MTTVKHDPLKPNKYGIIGTDPYRAENARPIEIEPGLFDGTKGGRFLLNKGQKGWQINGRIGYIGGIVGITAIYDGQLPENIILSPHREPGGEVDLSFKFCSLDILPEGMLDLKTELLVRRTY